MIEMPYHALAVVLMTAFESHLTSFRGRAPTLSLYAKAWMLDRWLEA
jgi:hypothetical protein